MKIRSNRRPGTTSEAAKAAPGSCDELLYNASLALEATIALAPLVPIPVLSSVFSSVQVIVNAAKKCREDRRAAAEVAEQAAEMAKMIHETVHGKEDRIVDDLKSALEDFELKLEDIKSIMLEQASASLMRRLSRRAQFSERLSVYRARLEYSMRTFSALSQARLEIKIEELRTEVQRLRKRHDDGYRIVHLGDLEFAKLHTSVSPNRACGRYYSCQMGSCDCCTKVFSATRKGDVKLVKMYRNEKTFRGELDFLKLTRRTPNLSFAQIEGYSSSSEGLLIVLTGVSTLNFLGNRLSDLDPVKRFAALLQVSCSWASVAEFLRNNALLWNPDYSKMQVDAAGELVIGVHDEVGRAVHERHNPGCTNIGMSINVGRAEVVECDNLGMAQNVESSRSLLKLLGGYNDDQMTFNNAMRSLQRLSTSFFNMKSITIALSSDHQYRVGQVRDIDTFKDGYMFEVPTPVTKINTVAHDEEHVLLSPLVPFGHKPRTGKSSHRVEVLNMGWEDQSSRPIPIPVGGVHSVELCIAEHSEPCDMGLSSFFCRFGPSLAKASGTTLQNLCFVTGIQDRRFAQFCWKDGKGEWIQEDLAWGEEQDSCEMSCQMCFYTGYVNEEKCGDNARGHRNFHVRALAEDLSVREPWGLFADELEPTPDLELDKSGIIKLDSATIEKLPWWTRPRHVASLEAYHDYLEPYYQTTPEVDVIYNQFTYVTYCQLPASLAGMIEWVHDRFPEKAKENERLFDEMFGGDPSTKLTGIFDCFCPT